MDPFKYASALCGYPIATVAIGGSDVDLLPIPRNMAQDWTDRQFRDQVAAVLSLAADNDSRTQEGTEHLRKVSAAVANAGAFATDARGPSGKLALLKAITTEGSDLYVPGGLSPVFAEWIRVVSSALSTRLPSGWSVAVDIVKRTAADLRAKAEDAGRYALDVANKTGESLDSIAVAGGVILAGAAVVYFWPVLSAVRPRGKS